MSAPDATADTSLTQSTIDRALAILRLFSIEQPEWTVDEIAAALALSGSTAYIYVGSLASAGLLVAVKAGRYTVGPAVIELDRITRRFDPLTRASTAPLRDLTDAVELPAVGLVCRLYRLTVICVDQMPHRLPDLAISYERGRPMPLIRGSLSKVILANLPSRQLRRIYDANPQAIAEAGLGNDWTAFKLALRHIRKAGVLATFGELDHGVVGISAPVFGPAGDVLGSVGLVLRAEDAAGKVEALTQRVGAAGESISATLRG